MDLEEGRGRFSGRNAAYNSAAADVAPLLKRMRRSAANKTSPNNQPTSLAKRWLTRIWTQNYARAESVPETLP